LLPPPPPVDDIDDIEERLAIRIALKKLSEHLRIILEMVFWNNMSLDEIATELQRPLPEITVMFKEARQQLKSLLENDFGVTES
jgi:DNA-directed RNA polymerase specialized sigma24 family protein